MKLINRDTTFFSKKHSASIVEYKNCLEKYAQKFLQEISLVTKSPIFLDTNILLRYYSISFTARQKLFEFIEKYSDRIIISSQVQIEFIKNREDVIQRFFEQVTNKIPKDYNSDIISKTKHFLEQHKVVLKDYPFVETGISKSQKDLEALMEKLNETVEKKREEHINLIVEDEFLDLLSKCILFEPLTAEEITLIKNEFDDLKKQIGSENVDTIVNKPNEVFPGLGDIKEKPDDPYGDYIIYHEMMKYMINSSTDILFLTFDNTKGDWMTKKKAPHLRYVLNSFLNTGNILYIVDAERTLEEILDVNIESLISEPDLPIIANISIESLNKMTETLDVFKNAKRCNFTLNTIEELRLYGYNSIQEIERDVLRASEAVKKFAKDQNTKLNVVGITRVALRIANPSITSYIDTGGNVEELPELDMYEAYRGMLK